jgi:glucokinase
MTVIGVDIGGTKIAVGRVNDRVEVLCSQVVETRAGEGLEASLRQVCRAIEELLTPDVSAIGICAPGPLDPRSGVVLNPPNLPGWVNIPLAQIIAEKFARPVRLENDCNAAGLAEARYGAARGCTQVFYAGVGTGVGTGIILNGDIYHGAHGAAGEGGHVTIDYRSPIVCGCGVAGCIEAMASGTAIERHKLDLEETAERLGAWLGAMVSLLDPEIIVIGGGVARMGEPLFGRLRSIVPRKTINPHRPPIVPAQFDSGIVGAAAVALERC